ncbi:hypothetical protein M378DRAFT_1041652 [Amanita muscaria Koide BX008]|uniref:Uncharacterized protein n=1 Tax=Amanita muscaria (strain Koide BX008) TaxID=946122 RepID=A0A0C2SNR3_AMAMK|nr:hypothetical protein M378DRAFT_1041652 [Amanita muscaria Koide BX008]
MKSMITEEPIATDFHWHGFDEFWQPPDSSKPKERVYGELYSSEAFRHAERRLLNQPPEPDCDLPRVIYALMFSSDATHVAQFGQASLWPAYVFSGNCSKYTRCMPSTRSARHFAYFPKLPDSFEDFLRKHGLSNTAPLKAHCRRELFHAVWKLILDLEFQEAYRHGIVLKCIDGIKRRFYPRIFTYSADYPEKVLIALIRDMGNCPCPRCTVNKQSIRGMGTADDRAVRQSSRRANYKDYFKRVSAARKLIYEDGYVVNSDKVDELLKEGSWVPVENAFTKQLGSEFSVFHILVVDQLHEFELGVWKALLILSGFKHPMCGHLLCPIDEDWNNEESVSIIATKFSFC